MPRQLRLDPPEVLHHVMLWGIERRAIFRDNTDRAAFVTRMGAGVTATGTKLYCWALLPNHAHLGTGPFLSGSWRLGARGSRARAPEQPGSVSRRRPCARSVSGRGSARRGARWGARPPALRRAGAAGEGECPRAHLAILDNSPQDDAPGWDR